MVDVYNGGRPQGCSYVSVTVHGIDKFLAGANITGDLDLHFEGRLVEVDQATGVQLRILEYKGALCQANWQVIGTGIVT